VSEKAELHFSPGFRKQGDVRKSGHAPPAPIAGSVYLTVAPIGSAMKKRGEVAMNFSSSGMTIGRVS
jgi:hypothetical protein